MKTREYDLRGLVFNEMPDGYFQEVRAFAEKVGKSDSLNTALESVARHARNYDEDEKGIVSVTRRTLLYKDFAPYSFNFAYQNRSIIQTDIGIEDMVFGEWRTWIFGGIIFHGDHDGGGDGSAPTYSVCLTPTDGWSIHT